MLNATAFREGSEEDMAGKIGWPLVSLYVCSTGPIRVLSGGATE